MLYRDFYYEDKMVVRPYLMYLYNGNPFTGKIASSYLNGPLGAFNYMNPGYFTLAAIDMKP